jgi:hypothetical protein
MVGWPLTNIFNFSIQLPKTFFPSWKKIKKIVFVFVFYFFPFIYFVLFLFFSLLFVVYSYTVHTQKHNSTLHTTSSCAGPPLWCCCCRCCCLPCPACCRWSRQIQFIFIRLPFCFNPYHHKKKSGSLLPLFIIIIIFSSTNHYTPPTTWSTPFLFIIF